MLHFKIPLPPEHGILVQVVISLSCQSYNGVIVDIICSQYNACASLASIICCLDVPVETNMVFPHETTCNTTIVRVNRGTTHTEYEHV